MRGRNFPNISQCLKYVVTDFVTTSAAFLLFNIFRYYELDLQGNGYGTLCQFLRDPKLLTEQILVPMVLLLIFWLSGYYNAPFRKSRLSEFNTTLLSVITATLLLFFVLLINDTTGIKLRDYEVIFVLFGLLFSFVYAGRWLNTHITMEQLRKRRLIYSTLIIGNSHKSRQIYKKLKDHGSVWAYDVMGFIRLPNEHQINDEMRSWDWEEVEKVCKEHHIDQIVLAPERIRDAQIMRVLSRLFPLNIPVKIAPDTLSYITGNIKLDDIMGLPFIDLTSPRISEFQKNVKRTSDVILSAIATIILSPLLIGTAIAVKLSSEGPIIYSQERIGRGRKTFRIYKFRSMKQNAEKDGPRLSTKDDTRVTPIGRFMRKYRIDELPQFWNVLKGDMSLVGPRPERAFYIEKIVKKAPYYGLVFQVRPGITGWGMVKYGYASNVEEMVRRTRYDLIYLNNMSISTDMKILIYTFKTIVKGSGM